MGLKHSTGCFSVNITDDSIQKMNTVDCGHNHLWLWINSVFLERWAMESRVWG